MHEPLLICVDDWTISLQLLAATPLSHIREGRKQPDSFPNSFLFLNTHDLVDRIFDVELRDIVSEFTSFDLGEIEKVLDKEVHDLRRRFLHLNTVL